MERMRKVSEKEKIGGRERIERARVSLHSHTLRIYKEFGVQYQYPILITTVTITVHERERVRERSLV
jgi:hypothetical protein